MQNGVVKYGKDLIKIASVFGLPQRQLPTPKVRGHFVYRLKSSLHTSETHRWWVPACIRDRPNRNAMHGIPRATIDLDSIDNLNLGTNGFVCFAENADRVIQIRNRVVWARAGTFILSYLYYVYGSAERGGWVFNSYTSSCKAVTKYAIIFNTFYSEISEYISNSTRKTFLLI